MTPTNDAHVCCYVVRHGRTTLNASGSFRGNVNPPLDSVGLQQAEKLAELFQDKDISAIFSSEKQRATKTADTIAKGRSIPIHQSPNLTALNVGHLSGQKRTPENIKLLISYLDNPECVIPGGESLNQFKSRVDPCIEQAIKIGLDCGCPAMIVAHSSIIREVGSVVYGDHKKTLVEPGGAVAIYIKNGKYEAEPIYRPMTNAGKADTIS